MNVTIFGANSTVGKYLADLFIENNHSVTAFVNKPGSIKLPDSSLKIIVGHNYDKMLVRNAIKDADIVINAYIPEFKLFTNRRYFANNISNETIIKEMIDLNKKRFITFSRATSSDKLNPFTYLNKLLYKSFVDEFKLTYSLLESSNSDWTIVDIIRTNSANKKSDFTYDFSSSFISNINLAYAVYEIASKGLFKGEKIAVSNKKNKV